MSAPSTPSSLDAVIDYSLPYPNVRSVPLFALPQQPSSAVLDMVAELHRVGRASRYLADYAATVLEMIPATHHRVICEAVDGLLNDEYDELVINTPPGSAKSSYTSHALGAYFLGRFPRKNIILATHTAELSERWSGKVRNTVTSPEHQRVFPDSILSRDTTARSRWATSLGGEFLAAGVGASILGFRADLCLTENAQVCTKAGYTSISNIRSGDEVLAYDTEKLSTGYHRVVAVAERDADHIYRIHTADGRVVEATGNHPFYSGGHFVPAMALAVGDPLLSAVWKAEDNVRLGDDEIAFPFKVGDGLLQQKLCERLQSAANNPELQSVRKPVSSPSENNRLLFSHLFRVTRSLARAAVCSMRNAIQTAQSQVSILFNVVQKRASFSTDAHQGQPELAGRQESEPLQGRKRKSISCGTKDGNVLGQSRVCHLYQHGEPSWSSCGRERTEQLSDQHRDPMPVVSHDVAWRGARETAETVVARIEVVRGDTRVFDIQVEGVSNFFANGILVHNCLIDDPIGGFEQAQSETQLKKVQDWFETDLLTRLKPRAKLVLICQRLSPNDLAGYLIERNAMNPTRRQRVLTLRMEAEDGDPDDGTHRKPGDRLWPEWFTQQMVEDARRDPYRWQTLYQQRPPSAKGDWVPPQHIRILAADDPAYTTAALHYYLCIDLALSINKGDYTVILTVGIDARGMIHVVDAWRERVAIEVTTDRLIDFVAARRPMECLIDDDNAAKVFLQLVASRARERGTAVPMKMMKMMGQDKETRAAPLRGLFRSDRVFLKRAPWNEWLVRELLIFPNAMGAGVDDGVDALGLIGRRLVQLARPALPAIYTPPPTLRQMCLEDLYDDRDRAKGAFSRKRF